MPGRRNTAPSPLSWEDLRLVLAIVRHGRLADAASDLGIDPSNVGRRLSALDDRLGSCLFERTPAGLLPAVAVQALRVDLEAMEGAALNAERKLAAGVAPIAGRVKIAASQAFAMYVLCRELAALRDDLPDVEIELVASLQVASLARREADVALRFLRPEQQDVHRRRLGSVRWSVYGARSYLRGRPRPDPKRGLADHHLVRWGGPPIRPAVDAWLAAHAARASTALVASELHLLVEACAAGLGLAVLPGVMARSRGDLQRVVDYAVDETDLWLVMHRDVRKVPRVRAVADALASRLGGAREKLGEI